MRFQSLSVSPFLLDLKPGEVRLDLFALDSGDNGFSLESLAEGTDRFWSDRWADGTAGTEDFIPNQSPFINGS